VGATEDVKKEFLWLRTSRCGSLIGMRTVLRRVNRQAMISLSMLILVWPAGVRAGISPGVAATAPATTKGAGAVDLTSEMLRYAALIRVDSPFSSPFEFDPNYPPFDAKWREISAQAYEQNAAARAGCRAARLKHGDRLMDAAKPPRQPQSDVDTFVPLLSLARDLADAALHAEASGDTAGALLLVEDALFLANVVVVTTTQETGPAMGPPMSVAARLSALTSLAMIMPAVQPDAKGLLDRSVCESIERIDIYLQRENDWIHAVEDSFKAMVANESELTLYATARNRAVAEVRAARVGLAVQRFRFDHARWPANEKELVPAYLPEMPLDPTGQAGERMRYILIRDAQPLGVDRPVVAFLFDEVKGQWFYRTDRPCYGWVMGDGSNRTFRDQQHLNHVRDLSRWVPAEKHVPTDKPATAPLPMD
jgi:hypothetical protein